MKRFEVMVPLAGHWWTEVEAENAEEAFSAAIDAFDPDKDMRDVEFEFHRHIVKGNVCYASMREFEANEIGDDDESA